MLRTSSMTVGALALALAVAGCGGGESTGDDAGGGGDVDAGGGGDAGGGDVDAGGGGDVDAGGGGDVDASTPPTDGGTPTRMGAVGSACAMDGDCTEPPGSTCQTMVGMGGFSYEFPGGYCTHTCTAGSGSSECGAGADCYSVGFGGFGSAFCAKTCTSNADCRESEGYTCQMPPFGGGTMRYCLPPTPGFGGRDGGGFPGFEGGMPGFP